MLKSAAQTFTPSPVQLPVVLPRLRLLWLIVKTSLFSRF